MVKIDLHVHASERSACAQASEEQQIQAAIAVGLDAIVFTDHHRLMSSERLEQLNAIYQPFLVFNGIEITVDGEDILVYGVHSHRLETNHWHYPQLHAYVRSQNGLMILAHPFRFRTEISIPIDQFIPDFIEYRSANTPKTYEDKIKQLSEELGIGLVCNSDAHVTEKLGLFYNLLSVSIHDEQELITSLLNGQNTCFACE